MSRQTEEIAKFRKRQRDMAAVKMKRYEGVSRNHTCPCGSGKKYKMCCWRIQRC
jgi:uncharacterized protein YecA (UPF0149 family)